MRLVCGCWKAGRLADLGDSLSSYKLSDPSLFPTRQATGSNFGLNEASRDAGGGQLQKSCWLLRVKKFFVTRYLLQPRSPSVGRAQSNGTMAIVPFNRAMQWWSAEHDLGFARSWKGPMHDEKDLVTLSRRW